MREREELEADVEDDVIGRGGVDLVMSQTPSEETLAYPRPDDHEPQVELSSCSVEI